MRTLHFTKQESLCLFSKECHLNSKTMCFPTNNPVNAALQERNAASHPWHCSLPQGPAARMRSLGDQYLNIPAVGNAITI